MCEDFFGSLCIESVVYMNTYKSVSVSLKSQHLHIEHMLESVGGGWDIDHIANRVPIYWEKYGCKQRYHKMSEGVERVFTLNTFFYSALSCKTNPIVLRFWAMHTQLLIVLGTH